ncbi:response regulator transcription factor [Pseudorhodoferax sp.]|uniref:response regulator transcription factor n=1 Tax=Pseudorhodoferax sp. TaxID=1993553 RepID=UPI002DD61B47|nr:response regulator transcription factor [Pseudorhodoferax sp.]
MPDAPASTVIRVALVEDDPFFLNAFSAAVRAAPDMLLHGTALNCRQGMALLAGPPAEVLLVDLGLPDGSGLDVIRVARRAWPQCHVMVSTVFGDEAHVIQSLEAGADGYLLKDGTLARITDEIRSVQAGGSPISPLIARQLLTRFRQGPAAAPVAADAEQAHLSPRERQVLEYIVKGFSYEEIGQLMGVTRNTVLSFVRRIYAKLKVRSQVEAIHEARAQGLLTRS